MQIDHPLRTESALRRALSSTPPSRFTLESVKQMVIGTPLESPMLAIRRLAHFHNRRRRPELKEIFAEQHRTEQVLKSFLRPASNCLDVGCHIGSFLSLLLRVSPHGTHMAFEALPEKVSRLRAKFTEVEIADCAVGERSGRVKFFRNLTSSGFSGMSAHGSDADELQQIDVRCMTLDDLVPSQRKIDFIKIDVEGSELLVIKGARSLISRSRPLILFECTLSGLASSNIRPDEVFGYINHDLKYKVFLLKDWLNNGKPLDLRSFAHSMEYPFKAFNFLAAPA